MHIILYTSLESVDTIITVSVYRLCIIYLQGALEELIHLHCFCVYGAGAVASCEMDDREEQDGYVVIGRSQENLNVSSLSNPRMVCLYLYPNT